MRAAGEAEGKLWGAVAAFGWRWAALAGSTAAGGVAAVLLAGWLSVWWQRHEVERLAAQRQALAAEVAQWQAQADAWAKKGGRAKLERCGDQGRLCVRVDTRAGGFGKEGDYMVLRGY
jgi:outer membrane murein-binding lipoprotein Lpp